MTIGDSDRSKETAITDLAATPSGKRLISPWILGALTTVPLLFTVGFALAAVAYTVAPPDPGGDLPENANVAFIFYTVLTATITALGVAVVVGLVRRWHWSRPLGVLMMLAATGLICVGIGTGLDSNFFGSVAGGGVAVTTCVATITLIATGR
jgi:hypothetical protein